jgi:pimeloyl-ACP methyl ester carboxylesterase
MALSGLRGDGQDYEMEDGDEQTTVPGEDIQPRFMVTTPHGYAVSVGILKFLVGFTMTAAAFAAEPLGIAMETYDYPYAVAFREFEIGGQRVRMAYMDVSPAGAANGRSVTLFHGKNFFGAYWKATIEALRAAGYRVVVPDQIGFGKSSKPEIPYSFPEMARHTKELLDQLGVKQTAVVGHSMGGMAAVRFTLMYPQTVTKLVLEDPIGLEDYRMKVPYTPTEQLYAAELKNTEESIRNYQKSYYVQWKPQYDEYVQAPYRQTLSGEYPRLAKVSALTSQMIYQQPVVHELPLIRTKTLLIVGQQDRTAPGKNRAAPEVQKTLGNYPQLGLAAARAIPGSSYVPLEGVGHIPHFEAPERFHKELLGFLSE